MTDNHTAQTESASARSPESFEFPIAKGILALTNLLDAFEHGSPPAEVSPSALGAAVDNQLVQVRLGIASSLFAALRCRNAAVASHSVRVALTCSAWALRLKLPPADRDAIEVAALLHDLGLIGVPDQILLKPGPLNGDESLVVAQGRRMSVEILRYACVDATILQIVENLGAWFGGSKGGYRLSGRQIPVGSRVIAIVEAFDAMTSDHVFRRAMSQERAMRELFESAGTQFDPGLVHEFAEFRVCDQTPLHAEMARRWLRDLDPATADSYWGLMTVPNGMGSEDAARRFETKLLENMHDAVVFIDAGMRIVEWNRGAERLTGIATPSVVQRLWSPSTLSMQNEKGEWLAEQDCPVHCAIQSQVQSLRRLTISGRGGRPVSVDTHAIPVTAADGTTLGAILLMHDASPEASLEERCQTLYEKATKDPLTQVANRAEFDRVLGMFVRAHKEYQVTCSLVICDLDHFKRVNDTYGHQAGDDVIQALASVLKDACRPGDLVARYGGEEFVMLCADCDNATAARRAEQVRKTLGQIRHARLEGRSVTASFGVTEVQPGDTPETMLRRADRALLMAKERGRNMVVQLGVGSDPPEPRPPSPAKSSPPSQFSLKCDLVTPVPLWVAVEKLRGFMADHRANVLKVEGNHVQLAVHSGTPKRLRRRADRPIAFHMEVTLDEEPVARASNETGNTWMQTRVHVRIAPERNRERRRDEVAQRARQILMSFRSYLMASQNEEPREDEEVVR